MCWKDVRKWLRIAGAAAIPVMCVTGLLVFSVLPFSNYDTLTWMAVGGFNGLVVGAVAAVLCAAAILVGDRVFGPRT